MGIVNDPQSSFKLEKQIPPYLTFLEVDRAIEIILYKLDVHELFDTVTF